MIALSKLIWYGLIGLFRSRASLEIEILVLRHQLNILRRRSPKRPILGRIDRLVFLGHCQTRSRYPLAPRTFSLVLAMEIAAAWRPPEGGPRRPRFCSRYTRSGGSKPGR
jgi:hypothetical protein